MQEHDRTTQGDQGARFPTAVAWDRPGTNAQLNLHAKLPDSSVYTHAIKPELRTQPLERGGSAPEMEGICSVAQSSLMIASARLSSGSSVVAVPSTTLATADAGSLLRLLPASSSAAISITAQPMQPMFLTNSPPPGVLPPSASTPRGAPSAMAAIPFLSALQAMIQAGNSTNSQRILPRLPAVTVSAAVPGPVLPKPGAGAATSHGSSSGSLGRAASGTDMLPTSVGRGPHVTLARTLPGPLGPVAPQCSPQGCASPAPQACDGMKEEPVTARGAAMKVETVGARGIALHDMRGDPAAALELLPGETLRCCNLCNEAKPLTEYYKIVHNYARNVMRFSTRCKSCIRADAHRWFEANKGVMTKRCDKCEECKYIGEFNLTINFTMFKFAYHHDNAWERGLERYCRKCTYQHQKEHGIIARKQAKRRERAHGRQAITVTEKRCSKCQLVKAAELFPKDKYMVDGLYIYCKPCTSEMKKRQKAERMAQQAASKVKEKYCRRCQQSKDIENFRRSPSNRDGHVNVCKDCQISAERLRRTGSVGSGNSQPLGKTGSLPNGLSMATPAVSSDPRPPLWETTVHEHSAFVLEDLRTSPLGSSSATEHSQQGTQGEPMQADEDEIADAALLLELAAGR